MAKKVKKAGRSGGGSRRAKRVDAIPLGEFARRRDRALKGLKGAAAIVYAGEANASLRGTWQPDGGFLYLTGIEDEQGAVLLLDPGAEDPRRRVVLFLRHHDPEIELWDGYRERIGESLRARYGLDTVMRLWALPRALTQVARRRKRFACLHAPSLPSAPVGPDLAMYRKLAERTIGVTIEDRSDLLPSLRSVKSSAELALLARAIEATEAGHRLAMEAMRPGATEADVCTALVRGFEDAGGQGMGYNPIVGAGVNSTVLHYMRNDAPIGEDDLVLIDAAASYGGYVSDITRTYPAGGRYTKRQREIYDLVLEAQLASIAAVKPGAAMWQVHEAARRVIERAGHGDAFMHGIGHHLGLEVHDAEPDGTLKPGMVVTIEPGVYLPSERIGVRIEDDILVTDKGRRNLSKAIVKDPQEIERIMKNR